MAVRRKGGDPEALRPAPASAEIAQFFVPAAASLHERRPRTLKHADTFAVFDHNGDVTPGPGSPEGIFHRDTRHLSLLCMTVDGHRPLLLSSALRDDNAMLTCDLTNPDIDGVGDRGALQHDMIHIRRSRFLWRGRASERLALQNFDAVERRVTLSIGFDADFADIFEVRGSRREARGTMLDPVIEHDAVTLRYDGLDGRRRETRLRFEPAPDAIGADRATFDLTLEPGRRVSVFVEVACDRDDDPDPPKRMFFKGLKQAGSALRRCSSAAASIATSNEIFNEAARRAVSDLYMLSTRLPGGLYPYAGIPWFSTVFGRDAIITALETLWLDPGIAAGVLRHLALHQADAEDPVADAEPGKILHEMRDGEMAHLGEVPFRRYYGSVDATPLFVMLAGAYLDRTGDLALLGELWPNVRAALDWMADWGDRDGDGFVEYGRRTAEGLVNQGWKDSHDSIFHADGSLAQGPVALVEVQAYAYAAWRAGAEIAAALRRHEDARGFSARAERLRADFDAAFFDPALGTYVLALDGAKRPCRVRSSNAGHALYAGVALPERAGAVVRSLMQPTSFSGWGVRTIPTTEARYNPMSYHNGSVWPHDNAMIAAGFARYGHRAEAARVFTGLFEASIYIDQRRLPELFCGFRRQRSQGPTFYPVACAPQAWAAGAMLSMVQSCLGLGFDAEAGAVTFDRPCLPDFVEDITLRRLGVAGGSIDVMLSRVRSEVAAQVLERRGAIGVHTRT